MMRVLALILVVGCDRAPSPVTRAWTFPNTPHARRLAFEGKARVAYERHDHATCGALFERAERWYDAATCRALAGDADAAFTDLSFASVRDLGLFELDADLASLHGDRRWPALREAITTQLAAYRATVHAELFDLYVADQADRSVPREQMDWKVIEPRDRAREARVRDILAAGEAKVADDFYHAAMMFQHAHAPDAQQRARDLALEAVARDPGHAAAKWLAAAALDRMLMAQNKPQKFGTQFRHHDGVWRLWDVDPATTDQERDAWNVPPLAEAHARVAAMNAK